MKLFSGAFKYDCGKKYVGSLTPNYLHNYVILQYKMAHKKSYDTKIFNVLFA